MKRLSYCLAAVILSLLLVSCGSGDLLLEKEISISDNNTVFGGDCQIFNGNIIYIYGIGKLSPKSLKQKTKVWTKTIISDLSLLHNDILSSVLCNEDNIYVISYSDESKESYIYKLNGKEVLELAHIDKMITESTIYNSSMFLKEVGGNLYMLNLSNNEMSSIHGGIDDFCINNDSLYYLYSFKGYKIFKYDLKSQDETLIGEIDFGGELLSIDGDYIVYLNNSKLCLYNYNDKSTLDIQIEDNIAVSGAYINESTLYINTLKDDSQHGELIEYSISDNSITEEHRLGLYRIDNLYYTTENGVIYVKTCNDAIYEINNGVAKEITKY
ncbi:MAG: hypothetical protein PUC29_08805 [Clostridia bacterium]|nr:hypothetical protein [Clostridia bacterium]